MRVARLALAAALVVVSALPAAGARNVILMVADGAGYNTWRASALYDGTEGREFFREPGWVQVAMATYALRDGRAPAGTPPDSLQDPTFIYDPQLAWSRDPAAGEEDGYPFHFAGYRWLRRAPDSANTGTALSTGRLTYIGAINVDGYGRPVEETLVTAARRGGRSVGVVTDVQLCHATPASLGGAHAPQRRMYCTLATEMLTTGRIDVLGGCGHPGFDDDGRPVADPDAAAYRYVGGRRVWEELRGARTLRPGDRIGEEFPDEARDITAEEIAALRAWTLVESREEIERLSTDASPVPPAPLLLVPRVRETLQANRKSGADPRETAPGEDPRVETVPALESLTRAALRVLEKDRDGFYLHVEGGAVDWAMHGNEMGRMIEEMAGFRRTVAAVIDWVERESSWSETLVIVTADHDHLLWGPESDRVPFQPLEDRGPGRMPGHRWLSDYHSNSLVPLFARGAGARELIERATGRDPVRDVYLHQVDVHSVMADELGR